MGRLRKKAGQDASISAIEPISPQVSGNAVQPLRTTLTTGVLGSYRYLLTPRSGLELNYGWAQDSFVYSAFSAGIPTGRVHARQQEISGAYVYSRNYKNYNPFVEAGVGGMIFTPILDNGTTRLDSRQEHQYRWPLRCWCRLRNQPQLRHPCRIPRLCSQSS